MQVWTPDSPYLFDSFSLLLTTTQALYREFQHPALSADPLPFFIRAVSSA